MLMQGMVMIILTSKWRVGTYCTDIVLAYKKCLAYS